MVSVLTSYIQETKILSIYFAHHSLEINMGTNKPNIVHNQCIWQSLPPHCSIPTLGDCHTPCITEWLAALLIYSLWRPLLTGASKAPFMGVLQSSLLHCFVHILFICLKRQYSLFNILIFLSKFPCHTCKIDHMTWIRPTLRIGALQSSLLSEAPFQDALKQPLLQGLNKAP